MEGPPSGIYRICLATPDGPHVIGADTFIGAPQRPVVFEGTDHVWQVEEVERGLYRLTLQGGWYSGDAERKVMVDEHLAPGQLWRIHRWDNSAFFIIEKHWRALPRLVWTLPEKIRGEQVVLRQPREPYESQKWYFEHIRYD